VNRRGGGLWLLAALVTMLAWTAFTVAAVPARATTTETVTVSGRSTGQAMKPGFLGVSLEFRALHVYTGRNPKAINPVLLQLLRNLNPGQAPIVRIGGDSTDSTWWPMRGVIPPSQITYSLTQNWLQVVHSLASDLGARLILGVNLAAGRPAIAGAEARAFLQGIGRTYIDADEIGNEPDFFPGYTFSDLLQSFPRWTAAMPRVPLAGPAVADPDWLANPGQFISVAHGLKIFTLHRYALRNCEPNPASADYPSAANLLADSSSYGLAQSVAPFVTLAHAHGLQFRVGEFNSTSTAACIGKTGVGDQFASALWMLDTLFDFASVGVDGVNVHSLPDAVYQLFTFAKQRGSWHAFVDPDYYGMLMFAQAFPPAARLLSVSAPSGLLKVWATLAHDDTIRVVLINKDLASSYSVKVDIPNASGPVKESALLAPSYSATDGVTLGGKSFGVDTTTGNLFGSPQIRTVQPTAGGYSVAMPPASAVVLTTQHTYNFRPRVGARGVKK
jgi:hypothetical protein